jgi:hypothetical protein
MSEHEYRLPLAGAAGSIEGRRRDWRTRSANILYCAGFLIADWPPDQLAAEAAERMHRLAGYWIFCGNNLYDGRWRNRKGVWALYPGAEPSDYWRALGEATRRRETFGPDPAPDSIHWLPQLPGRLDATRSGRHRVEGETLVVSRTHPALNLLRDPSFEMDWTSRKDTPWRNYYFPKRDDKIVHGGAWAMRVDANRKYANLKQTFPVLPVTAYLLTFWQRKADLLGDIGYTVAWGKQRQRAAGTSDWAQLRQFVETGPDEREGTVVFGLQSSYGSIWYDDADVREVETVHVWTDPVELPAGKAWLNVDLAARVPFTARVTLDVFDESGEKRLLFPCEAECELKRDLRGLACMRPDLRTLRLRLTVELGGAPSHHVEIKRLRVGVTPSR